MCKDMRAKESVEQVKGKGGSKGLVGRDYKEQVHRAPVFRFHLEAEGVTGGASGWSGKSGTNLRLQKGGSGCLREDGGAGAVTEQRARVTSWSCGVNPDR